MADAHGGQVGVGEGVVAGQLAGASLGEGRQEDALEFMYRAAVLAARHPGGYTAR